MRFPPSLAHVAMNSFRITPVSLLLTLATALTPLCTAQADEAAPANTTPKLAYGLLLKQGEKLVFAPCRDRSYALVEDISPDQSVIQGLKQVGLEQGKKLYVELVGTIEGLALKASALNLARTNGRCQQPGNAEESWEAAGRDPGWRLAAGGSEVRLKLQDGSTRVWPYQEFTRDGKAARFKAQTGQEKIDLQFAQTLCRDPLADAVFGWTATLSYNGQTLKGCAWQR